MTPDAALVVCRFLHDAAAMFLWGAFAYLSALVDADVARKIGQRLESFRIAAITVIGATAAVALPLKAAMIGNGWGDAFNPSVVWPVLFETTVGRAWRWEAAGSALLMATLVAPARLRAAAAAGAAGVVLTSLALTGHAVAHAGWLGIVHRANDALHILSGGAWLGALVPLFLMLGDLEHPERWRQAETVLTTFSIAGHLAVGLVIATGLVNTFLVLGHWPGDWSSPYQALLGIKIVLVLVMVFVACINRYRFMPQMARYPAETARAIRAGAAGEIVLGTCVVTLVAIIGMLAPV